MAALLSDKKKSDMNIRKCFFLLSLSLCRLLPMAAQDTLVVDLQAALHYAYANHPDLKQVAVDEADARWRVEETRAIGIPHLSAGVGYQYFIDIPTQILPDFITPSVYGVLFQEGIIPPKDVETGGGVPAQFGTKHNLSAKLELQTMIADASYFVGLEAVKAYRQFVAQNEAVVREQIDGKVREAFLTVLMLRPWK